MLDQKNQPSPLVEHKHENHPQLYWSDSQKFLDKAAQMSGLKARPKIADVNQEFEAKLTFGERIADVIAEFSGSIPFLLINLGIFTVWIVINTLGPKNWHFDEYPFQFLTMAVSLEAIFLSIFVLVSQNRQAEKDRIAAKNDFEVNKLGEVEIQAVLLHLEEQDRLLLELMGRFDQAFGQPNLTNLNDDLSGIEETVVSHGMMVTGGKHLEDEHCQKVRDDLQTAVAPYLEQSQLEASQVRDTLGYCYAIVNIESFQRNVLLEPDYKMDDNKLSVLKILYKEAYISIGADYDKPDAEDLNEVRDLLLKRMKARALDPRLVEKYAQISRTLICKVPGANC